MLDENVGNNLQKEFKINNCKCKKPFLFGNLIAYDLKKEFYKNHLKIKLVRIV